MKRLTKNNKKIYIFHHAGLGDYFSCNGIVRFIYQKNKNKNLIYLFVPENFKNIIKPMYKDLRKLRILIIPNKVTFEKFYADQYLKNEQNYELIKIGFDYFENQAKLHKSKKFLHKIQVPNRTFYTCDTIFYKQLKIPFKNRYKLSYWKRNRNIENKLYNKLVIKKPYAFVHDDPERGFVIEDKFINSSLQIIRNNKKVNILHYGKILENANEIHVMESSIRCMIETINTKNASHHIYMFNKNRFENILYTNKKMKIIGSKKNWKFRFLSFENNLKLILINLKFKIKKLQLYLGLIKY